MVSLPLAESQTRTKLARLADWLVVAVAVSLPWSTSATSILLVLWLIALIPTLDWPDVRRELMTPAGGLPVLLFLLGLVGMAWADVSWLERWKGLDSFFKLPVIPLLFVQFRRSGRGVWVFGAFVASCVVLLVATALVTALPPLPFIALQGDGVLVKNGSTQSGEFVACIFGMLFLAVEWFQQRRWLAVLAVVVGALGMLANMVLVSNSRTALFMIPVLSVVFAAKKLSGRGAVLFFGIAAFIAIAAWSTSPFLRERVTAIVSEIHLYEATDEQNSSGERIEFAKKSFEFFREAPIIGHGSGSIHTLFEKSSAGRTGAAGSATSNPHNQTFAVGIQLGLVGIAVLWAMWLAHLVLFRKATLADWIGLMIVVQNVVGSLFNSHLFDFVQGWLYVIGVGVAGGLVLKQRSAAGSRAAAP